MGKKPVLVIFFSVLLVFSFVQFSLDVRSTNLKGYEIHLQKRERDVRLLAALTESLIMTERRDVVEGHLEDAIHVGWIDFYMLTFDGEVTLYNSVRPLSTTAYDTLADLHPPEAFWGFDSTSESSRSIRGPASADIESIENFRFIESDLGGGRRLKLGFNIDREAFLAESTSYTAQEDRRVFVLSLILVMGVFLFSARDLLKVAKVVRTKGIRGLKDIKILSEEAAALRHGLEGFGEAVGRLETQNKKLSAQILPSLRSELQSGKTPPYDFNCTMVRTDINNFTKIFHGYPVEEFLATINEFFVECSHIISRYDGFIHEFVGDEIIFYFKDEQHENSFTAALACTREIQDAAERIHAETSTSRGYAFRIKSSLSYGKIRFGRLLNGFSLAGAPLIETTRILSAVNEKNENTVHFDSSNTLRLHEGVLFNESFKAMLKGMDGERTIMRYTGHKSVESASPNMYFDYRSDSEIAYFLEKIGNGSAAGFGPDVHSALDVVARLHITKCHQELTKTLLNTLQVLLSGDRTSAATNRALSKLAEALPRLVPIDQIEAFIEIIAKLTEDSDSRVVANSIETLQAFRSSGRLPRQLDDRLLDSSNTRVAANALVFAGTSEITNDVVRRLRKLISSNDSNEISAGIFAWGEIAKYHFDNDPVHYRTQAKFRELSLEFESLANRHPAVYAHALEAARKAGDESLAGRLTTRACA